MNAVDRVLRRLRFLVRGGAADREMDEEMRFHLEMEEAELLRAGHSPKEARRLARVRFGGLERFKERGRDARGGRWASDLLRDLRFAVRGLRRRPTFSGVVLLTLTLGIGSTAAVFTLASEILLRPLPFPEPDRIVSLETTWEGQPDGAVSPAEYLDYRQVAGEVFEAFGVWATGASTLTGRGGAAERVPTAFPTAGVFPALGLEAALGRTFTDREERTGADVAVLSHGLWARRFGADPSVLGRVVEVSGAPFEVIGVLEPGAVLPGDLVDGDPTGLYLPLGLRTDTTYQRGSHFLQGVGRLRDGVSVAEAAGVIEGVVDRFTSAFPDDYAAADRFRATVVPLARDVTGPVRTPLLVLLGAVALVLLVAGANVASLLLARGESRRGEMALRATLGAGRGRLVRQLLVESTFLAALGSAAGLLLAAGAVEALVRIAPPGIPRLGEVGVGLSTVGVCAALALACGLAFGLLPALQVAPRRLAATLHEGAGRGGSAPGGWLRPTLVAGEIAVALTLLTGAGLLGRTLMNLTAVDPGIRVEEVVSTRVGLPSSRYPGDEDVRRFVRVVEERIRALPGVRAAGWVTNLPLATPIGDLGVQIVGRPVDPDEGSIPADWAAVTPGYPEAVGMTLLRGRLLGVADRADAPGAVLINRTFAERHWPGEDPLGAAVRLGGGAAPETATVVGIVEDVAHEGPGAPRTNQIYVPHAQFRFWHGGGAARAMSLVVHSPRGAALVPEIRRVFRESDPDLGLASFVTLEEAYADVLARPRMLLGLLGAFALTTLVLAAVGVYGVMAYAVGRRRREFGIRMALGAPSRRIAGSVVADGIRVTGVGLAAGVIGALLLSRTLSGLLFGVEPGDPLTLGGMALLLGAVAVAASWLPARRALRTDPATPLRAD